MRLTARKNDDKARRPDTQFRRVVDRIEFEVRPGTGGRVTEITGEAKTFAEYSTQRGPTEEQEKTSETAQHGGQDADRQVQHTGGFPLSAGLAFRPITSPTVPRPRECERGGTAGPRLESSAPVRAELEPPPPRKPSWLKVRAPGGPNYAHIKTLMRELDLHTVCEEARCPNIGECWEHKAATFMILGDVCTRNCTYCAVAHGTPAAFDPLEPARLAEAVHRMGLEHVVITSVDRDDLPNGGAEAFAGMHHARSASDCPRPRSRCSSPISRAPSARCRS